MSTKSTAPESSNYGYTVLSGTTPLRGGSGYTSHEEAAEAAQEAANYEEHVWSATDLHIVIESYSPSAPISL